MKAVRDTAVNWHGDEVISRWTKRYKPSPIINRYLNDGIARQANQANGCTEARFKSQALLDDATLLTCMSYVDLNLIRTKITDRLDASDLTSIQDRIRHDQKAVAQTGNRIETATSAPALLEPFFGGEHKDKTSGLTFMPDYLELTDSG